LTQPAQPVWQIAADGPAPDDLRDVRVATVQGRRVVFIARESGAIGGHDVASGDLVTQFQGPADTYRLAVATIDGRDLLLATPDTEVKCVYDPATGRKVNEFSVDGMHWSEWVVPGRHGPLLAVDRDDVVDFWDIMTGGKVGSGPELGEAVRAVCGMRSHGRELIAAGYDGPVEHVDVWDRESGDRVTTLLLPGNCMVMCALPRDGQAAEDLLVTRADGNEVSIWDPSTGKNLSYLSGPDASHERGDIRMCPVPVGERHLLATAGSTDGAIRLWDPLTGHELTRVETGGDFYSCHYGGTLGEDLIIITESEHSGIAAWRLPAGGVGRAASGVTIL
jgi:WD40 repeat protein